MKLGNDRIVVIEQLITGDVDEYGEPLRETSSTLVRFCSITPTRSPSSESLDRSAAGRTVMQLLAPRGTALSRSSIVLWPAVEVADGVWSGPRWEVWGDPLPWTEGALEATLTRIEG